MGIKFAIENIALAPLKFENWFEVITSTLKQQEPAKLILKNGLRIEAIEHLRYLVREIFIWKVYNPSTLPIGGNDVVVDIGAHNGLFSLFAASITQNMIYAFEPAPENFDCLQRNIDANGLTNVTSYNVAVSDKIGLTKLFLNPGSGAKNLLFEQIHPDKVEKYKDTKGLDLEYLNYLVPGPDELEQYIEVPTTTLQEIMDSNKLERIDFLKLDCEGSEGPILFSTPGEHLKRVKKIAMEFHDQLSQFDHNQIQKHLAEAGFNTQLRWNNKSPVGYLYAWHD